MASLLEKLGVVSVIFLICLSLPFGILSSDSANNLESREGRHIIVTAPAAYINRLASQLPVFDEIYDLLYDLTGLYPFNGEKITILYDSSIDTPTAYAGNPIRIGKGLWGEDHFWLIGHEMSHDFTIWIPSPTPKVIFISPGPGFIEGWAQFARQYIFYVLNMEGYRQMKTYFKDALDKYIQDGRNFTMLKTVEYANAFAGIMQNYSDTYGWDTVKSFFRLVSEQTFLNVLNGTLTLEERASIFVRYLSLAANEDLLPLFRDWWKFPAKETYVINITVGGLPISNSTLLFIDNFSFGSISSCDIKSFIYTIGSNHTASIPSPLNVSLGTRYFCKNSKQFFSSGSDIFFLFNTQHFLSVNSVYGNPEGTGWYNEGSTATFSINLFLDHQNGTRRIFVGWTGDSKATTPQASIIMEKPHTVIAIWKTQYYLTVKSDFGASQGEGWYDAGEVAVFSISSTQIDHENRTKRVFVGWTGDLTAITATASIAMDSPKRVVAIWKTVTAPKPAEEEIQPPSLPWGLYATIAAVAIVAIGVATIIYRRSRASARCGMMRLFA